MTFEDLVFKPHALGEGVQALHQFPNDYGVSVVGGARGLYGDGVGTFEIAILHHDAITYRTPITSDVLAWQTKDEVTAVLAQVEALPAVSKLEAEFKA